MKRALHIFLLTVLWSSVITVGRHSQTAWTWTDLDPIIAGQIEEELEFVIVDHKIITQTRPKEIRLIGFDGRTVDKIDPETVLIPEIHHGNFILELETDRGAIRKKIIL